VIGLLRSMTPLERRTFRLHLASSVLEGVAGGVILIHDFFARRTLEAAAWQITILVSLWPVASLVSVYFADGLDGGGRVGRILVLAGLLGRLPMALMALSGSIYAFLPLAGLFYASFAVAKPAQNLIIQANYGETKRGEIFSWTWGVYAAVAGFTSIGAGALLDAYEEGYRLLLPLEACAGLGALALLAAVPAAPLPGAPVCQQRRGLARSFRKGLEILRDDPAYRRVERNFMVYGLAFMVVLPALPILADQDLGLTYMEVGLARGILGQVVAILVMPWFGRRLDRLGPAGFSSHVFAILVAYAALIGLSPCLSFPARGFWFCAGYLAYGIGMGGLHLVWHIGSMYYAPRGMVAIYQGIHVSLTGLRGLTGPLIGLVVLQTCGTRWPFALSALLFLAAALLMAKQAKAERR